MHQLSGYADKAHPGYVCKLDKALYGLKQAHECGMLGCARDWKFSGLFHQ
jgi:hypothetical protein